MMKRRYINIYIALAIIALGVLVGCFLSEYYGKRKFDPQIHFSCESGFYDAPIEVEMSVGANYFITYTLDGKAPNAACTRYEAPILISDASQNDNVWSALYDTSLGFFEGGYYDVPKDKVDKCTILRAAAFDYEGHQVGSETREYFVGYSDKSGYDGMYDLCVSSDPENFFSVDRGIYSVGEYLKGKIESCEIYGLYEDGVGWQGKQKKANWVASGRASERPGTIELFDPSGDLLIREACGVRVRGGYSRHDVQKPLGFYAREEYSGNERFSYDIFGDGYGPHTFLIHSLGNDCDVKIIDYVIYKALSEGDNSFSVTPMIPCNLFLEGEYWGPMYLMKDLNATTIAEDFNLKEDNILLIKSGNVKISDEEAELQESELRDWANLQNFIKENDMDNPDNYDYVCSMMDINDFAEYAATEIYIGNADWHEDNNYACWRTKDRERDNPYSDGKWRFCLFDVNWSFESEEVIWTETYSDWDFYHMVRCLCQNDEFKRLYLNKISELERMFAEEKIEAIVDEWSAVMEEPIRCNFKRFEINADADEKISSKKEQILNFCANRPAQMDDVNVWFFSSL